MIDYRPMEITPQELKSRLDQKENLLLIDVREPDEYDICRIEGSKLIPMRELPGKLDELDPKNSIVLYCHHGMRSLQAVNWLRKQGFDKTESLQGGIEAWAEEIDPKMERY